MGVSTQSDGQWTILRGTRVASKNRALEKIVAARLSQIDVVEICRNSNQIKPSPSHRHFYGLDKS